MKNILITGATDGIGKIAAFELAKQGHRVCIHGRNSQKVESTIKDISVETNNTEIKGFVADFADLNEVRQMAEKVKSEFNNLDILINNAGVFKSAIEQSKEGYDIRFSVNYLAPYVLTHALLPLLEESNDSRIINLSSAAQSELSHEALLSKHKTSVNALYAQSKLAITMWNNYLAKKHPNMTIIAVNPGSLLNTKMANEAYGQHWSPAEKGSDILLELALGDEHKTHSGNYFDNDSGHYAQAHPDAYNTNAIEELIDFTNKLID